MAEMAGDAGSQVDTDWWHALSSAGETHQTPGVSLLKTLNNNSNKNKNKVCSLNLKEMQDSQPLGVHYQV